MRFWTIACVRLTLALASNGYQNPSPFDWSSYSSEDILTRDVVVIGGGASGTYGAIKLKDMGKSVAVVEKSSKFGGHVHTYTDPKSGTAIDFGVQGYINNSVAADFFARFDVTTVSFPFFDWQTIFSDFRSGEVIQNYSLNFNLSGFAAQVHKYPDPGTGWHLPHPVPEDLVLPFQEFIEKYSLQDEAYTIANMAAGDGNILSELTAYVFQRINNVTFEELSDPMIGIKTNNNSELYEKARLELGSSALTDSTVIAADRSATDSGVKLIVQTPTGVKLIIASQILVSCPITLDNMLSFGLDQRELNIFDQITYTGYYVGLVTNTGIPNNVSYQNAAIDTPYHVPPLPAAYNIVPTIVPGIFYCWYGAEIPVSEDQIKSDITATIRRVTGTDVTPEFLAMANHTPYKQRVTAGAIKNGFYDDLNGLQGYRNTWYTGNAFDNSGTCSLWNFTRQILPHIAAAVDAQR